MRATTFLVLVSVFLIGCVDDLPYNERVTCSGGFSTPWVKRRSSNTWIDDGVVRWAGRNHYRMVPGETCAYELVRDFSR